MSLRWLLMALFAGCASGAPDASSSPDGEPSDDVHSDPPASTPTPLADTVLNVRVEPAEPAYDDDLVCRWDSGLPKSEATIQWYVNGHPYGRAVAETYVSGDTIPHLEQAGGQSWRCTVQGGDGQPAAVSEAVRVAPPVPMVVIPKGQSVARILRDWVTVGPEIELTRDFLMATTELTRDQYDVLGGGLRDPTDVNQLPLIQAWGCTWYGSSANLSPGGTTSWSVYAAMLNRLSVADGVEPCFTCTGTGLDVSCEPPPGDPYPCTGYRMPTLAEWAHAYQGAGQHEDMLPAGGNWTPRPLEDSERVAYDAEVFGPHAPPDSRISSQCQFLWQRVTRLNPFDGSTMPGPCPPPVGTLLPSLQGVYDLCGGAAEFVLDSRNTLDVQNWSPIDRYAHNPGDARRNSRVGSGEQSAPALLFPIAINAGGNTGLRMVRTLTPPPLARGGTP